MVETKIKPCPRPDCRAECFARDTDINGYPQHYVQCGWSGGCGYRTGTFDTEAEATAFHNSLASSPDLQRQRDVLLATAKKIVRIITATKTRTDLRCVQPSADELVKNVLYDLCAAIAECEGVI